MKTYLLDSLNRIKRLDESLDIKAALCDKPWVAFDEEGSKQCYIFKADNGLVVTAQGKGIETTWEFLPANKTIKIKDNDGSVVLYRPIVFNGDLLMLTIDGTNECAFLINENAAFKPKKLKDILIQIKESDEGKDKASKTLKSDTKTPKVRSLKSAEIRQPVLFAGEEFMPAERDGMRFYVNRDKRYAFSSVEHVFDKADGSIIVKDQSGRYTFYYNNSLANSDISYSMPYWVEYWDGLVLEGIFLNKKWVFLDGQWHRYYSEYGFYYIIESEEIKAEEKEVKKKYYKIDKNHLVYVEDAEAEMLIAKEQGAKLERQSKIGFACFLGAILAATIAAALSS